jgi:hypothetical protein
MNDSPLMLLREFASELGWQGLQQYQFALTPDICGSYPVGTIITSYITSDEKFNLQINENPVGQKRTYQATIFAVRYGLGPMGWHPIVIDGRQSAINEAARLKPVLSRAILRNPKSRRTFVREHSDLLCRPLVDRRTYRKLTGKRSPVT